MYIFICGINRDDMDSCTRNNGKPKRDEIKGEDHSLLVITKFLSCYIDFVILKNLAG